MLLCCACGSSPGNPGVSHLLTCAGAVLYFALGIACGPYLAGAIAVVWVSLSHGKASQVALAMWSYTSAVKLCGIKCACKCAAGHAPRTLFGTCTVVTLVHVLSRPQAMAWHASGGAVGLAINYACVVEPAKLHVVTRNLSPTLDLQLTASFCWQGLGS